MIKMKLDNKGMTLVELLLSIALIGLVLIFLVQLLNDLQHETDSNNFAYNNQINRIDAIYTIQKDLQKYTLVGIENESSNGKIIINFYYEYEDGTRVATLQSDTNKYIGNGETKTKYYLRYKSYTNEQFSWEMKGAKLDPCGSFKYYLNTSSDSYYFKINIPVYNSVYHDRNNKNRNNAIDDIEITFSDYKSNLDITNRKYLTNSNDIEIPIGYCAD